MPSTHAESPQTLYQNVSQREMSPTLATRAGASPARRCPGTINDRTPNVTTVG